MKTRFLMAASVFLLGAAQAQTQVGQVTLTPTRPVATSRNTTPAQPVRTQQHTQTTTTTTRTTTTPSSTTRTTTTKTTNTFVPASVPQGWYNLTGKVTGAETRLSAGSQIRLTLEDLSTPGTALLTVNFGSSRLPTPYQMYFNATKLKAGHSYGIRAAVTDAAGKTTYTSAPTPLPSSNSGTLNISVKPAR